MRYAQAWLLVPIVALFGGCVYERSRLSSEANRLFESLESACVHIAAVESDLARAPSWKNIAAVETAVGSQYEIACQLNRFANSNRGLDRFIPLFVKWYIPKSVQVRALSLQQHASAQAINACELCGRQRLRLYSDKRLATATEPIVDSVSRAIICSRDGNPAPHETLQEYVSQLDAAGKTRTAEIQREAEEFLAKTFFIEEQKRTR